MATFEDKKRAALDLLGRTRIWRSSYAPPIFTLLSKLGVKVRPPHFNTFLSNFLIAGIYFGIAIGLLFPIFRFINGDSLASIVQNGGIQFLETAIIAGALFGFFMALYYSFGAKKYKLPDWNTL